MTDRRIPDWILEDYYSGDFPAGLSDRDLQDSEIQNRIAALKKSDREFLEKNPPDEWVHSIMKRFHEGRAGKPRRLLSGPLTLKWAACAVSSLLIIGAVMLAVWNPGKNNSDIRIKGPVSQPNHESVLNIYRKRDGQIIKLEDGSHAQEGDLLQIAYQASAKTYGVILSLDGNGVVTLHYPSSPESSALLHEGEENFLANSFQLDDAPVFERFFFITSKSEIDIDAIFQKVELLGNDLDKARRLELELNGDLSQISLLILKGEDL